MNTSFTEVIDSEILEIDGAVINEIYEYLLANLGSTALATKYVCSYNSALDTIPLSLINSGSALAVLNYLEQF